MHIFGNKNVPNPFKEWFRNHEEFDIRKRVKRKQQKHKSKVNGEVGEDERFRSIDRKHSVEK